MLKVQNSHLEEKSNSKVLLNDIINIPNGTWVDYNRVEKIENKINICVSWRKIISITGKMHMGKVLRKRHVCTQTKVKNGFRYLWLGNNNEILRISFISILFVLQILLFYIKMEFNLNSCKDIDVLSILQCVHNSINWM